MQDYNTSKHSPVTFKTRQALPGSNFRCVWFIEIIGNDWGILGLFVVELQLQIRNHFQSQLQLQIRNHFQSRCVTMIVTEGIEWLLASSSSCDCFRDITYFVGIFA